MSELICPNCGTSNLPGEAICKSCKQPLFEESASESDWLNNLRVPSQDSFSEDQDIPQEESPNTPHSEDEENIPDWLDRIRKRANEELGEDEPADSEEIAPYVSGDEDLPEWLKEIQDIQPAEEAEPTSQPFDSNWINGISPPEETEPQPAEEVELPEWLDITGRQTGGEDVPPTSDEIDFEIWKPIAFEGDEQPEGETPTEESETQPQAAPDWLTSFASFEGEEQPEGETPAEESVTEPGAAPDWLSSFASVEGDEQAEGETPAEEGETQPEDAPDWLSSFASFEGKEQPEGDTPVEESVTEPGAAPAWLSSFASFEGDEQPEGETPAEEVETQPEGVPDWLSSFASFEGEEQAEGETFAEESETPIEVAPDWSGKFAEFEVENAAEQVESSDEEDEFFKHITSDSEPFQEINIDGVSLRDVFSDEEQVLDEGDEMPPFTSEGLPDWFTAEVPSEDISGPDVDAEESETPLEPAELPGWLQAIRPLEEVVPGRASADADQRIEKRGPLAGYQGVLPGDALVTRYSKPPVYSVKLQVSEKQRIYATLLENLINDEKSAKAEIREKNAAQEIIGRLLVGMVIVVLLALVLFSGVQITDLPSLYPPETVAFFTQIETLSHSEQPPSQVLVAIDYEAALSGELKTLSAGVVRDLLDSNTRLTMVSLVPAGPALADDLLRTANISTPPDDQVINLGFLPGGATGMASLAARPAQTMPADQDGNYAWDHPALQGISQVSDFDAVLLLSDNAENSRAWIEQLRPNLQNTPLLVIASAQVAPMVQPYVNSRQIDGLLAGLPGSASYAQLAQRPDSKIRAYWDAYQAGLLLIVILILAGSLYYGSRQLMEPRKPETKA